MIKICGKEATPKLKDIAINKLFKTLKSEKDLKPKSFKVCSKTSIKYLSSYIADLEKMANCGR